jgi:methyl-accepting chemotaxis protein
VSQECPGAADQVARAEFGRIQVRPMPGVSQESPSRPGEPGVRSPALRQRIARVSMNSVFEAVIGPGIRLMQNLRLPVKFALVSLAFMVPLGVATYGVVSYASSNIAFATDEQLGRAWIAPLNQLTQAILQRQRGEASATMRGDAAIAELQQLDRDQQHSLDAGDTLTTVRTAWNSTQDATGPAILLYSVVSDNSKLTLDPDLDSYYAMALTMDYAPKLAVAAAQLDSLLASIRTHAAITAEDRANAQFIIARVSTYHDSLTTATRRAIAANPSLATKLDASTVESTWRAFKDQAETLRQAADIAAIGTAADYASRNLIEATLNLSDATAVVLDELLAKRIAGFESHRNGLLAIALVSMVLVVYLITSFYLSNRRGFGALILRMHKLAHGDLTVNYSARGSDEISELIQAFDVSRRELHLLVMRIREATQTIDEAGQQIAQANDEHAQRESSRSASVRETADSAQQVSTVVQRNLDNALNANRLAEDAHGTASRGNEAVNKVVTTMDAITGSSRKIGDIIGVINEIAFQTNLLALNAAVEAARAGEQGRGFAVVASEVRNLAQRSASAADEIKKLISASIEDVERGAALVTSAGTTMSEILGSVTSVSKIMKEIALASRSQTEDIGTLNKAIERIDEDTQQNAARVEQTAAVAASLRDQVGHLLDAVGNFSIGNETPSTTHDRQHGVQESSPLRSAA